MMTQMALETVVLAVQVNKCILKKGYDESHNLFCHFAYNKVRIEKRR